MTDTPLLEVQSLKTHYPIRDGVFGTVSPHAEQLLGHPPLTLAASLATLDQ